MAQCRGPSKFPSVKEGISVVVAAAVVPSVVVEHRVFVVVALVLRRPPPPLLLLLSGQSRRQHTGGRGQAKLVLASPPARRKGQQDPPLHRSFYTCTDLSSTGRPCRVPTRGRRDWPLSGTTGRREDPGPTGGRRRASHAAPRNGPQRYSTATCLTYESDCVGRGKCLTIWRVGGRGNVRRAVRRTPPDGVMAAVMGTALGGAAAADRGAETVETLQPPADARA